jgi:hypothetical protein
MGTEPHSSRGPSPSAIGRQTGQQNAGGRTSGAASGRPSPLQRVGSQTPPCGRSCANSPSALGYEFVAQHALERVGGLRDRAAQGNAGTGREGRRGAMADSCETIATPRAYTGRTSRSRRMPLTVMVLRFAPPSFMAHRRGRGRVRVWVSCALSARSRAHRPAGGHGDGCGSQRAMVSPSVRRSAPAEVRQPDVLPRDSSGLT